MSEPAFIHLHIHSEYSLVDSIIQIDDLIARCKALKMPAVALTDRMNLFAAVKFYTKAIQAGIKPLFGAEIIVEGEPHSSSVLVLCQNHLGYKNLLALISKAYQERQPGVEPVIKKEWLHAYNGGLILLCGQNSDIGQEIVNEQFPLAQQKAEFWLKLFPQRMYLSITRVGSENSFNTLWMQLAQQLKLPLVATNKVCFLQPEDFEAHEARVCIQQGNILSDPKRPRLYSREQYLKSVEEMAQCFQDLPAACLNSVEIAKRCNVQLSLKQILLPHYPTENNLNDYLEQKARAGLTQRLAALKIQPDAQQYHHRLDLELQVIIKMGFAGYFLIVADFIQWARDNGVPVGPGRGSGAGSLVAYALKITNIDPLTYDLLFERFLNPERISMPDFDIDFCMEGRDRVIEYVAERYGRANVAQIITFGTMAARAVVRDVGRVLNHPYGFVDKIAKLIPMELGITLEKALQQEEQLQQRYGEEEEVRILLDLAKKLEGIVRNAGKHAGGVVISPTPLINYTPLYCEEHLVTQFDKDDVEAVGLVKFDFLGLRTLTIINWALQNINASLSQHEYVDIDNLSLDDVASFDLLKSCKTTGVFQLESRGMKDLIKRLQPDTFEDIIALVALFRPGPLQSGMVDDFINRKHGLSPIKYLHPTLEPILRATYGVILYQEQVMQIAQVLAGYSLGEADILRRAMGKKKPEEMVKQRTIFIEGARKNNIDIPIANQIFDLMEMFAGYGFNKSHSAAYAYVSYQTAWLKAHYPAAFLAAVLSSEMDQTEKVVHFIEECKHMQLKVNNPHINHSMYFFTVVNNETILYGLGALKGVGRAAIENIISHRAAQGAYVDLLDLCTRVELRKVNRRVFESLIRAGALDCFGQNRATLMAQLDVALKYALQKSQNTLVGQNDLFAESTPSLPHFSLPEWSDEERLKGEKEILGHYITGHPLNAFQQELQQIISIPLQMLPQGENKIHRVAGIIMDIKTLYTKRGDKMAIINLGDQNGAVEMAVFSDIYIKFRDLIQKDQVVIVEVEKINKDNKLNAKKFFVLEEARSHFAKLLLLKLSMPAMQQVEAIKNILTPCKGGSLSVCFEYEREEAKARIPLDPSWQVVPTDALLTTLRKVLGPDSVVVCY